MKRGKPLLIDEILVIILVVFLFGWGAYGLIVLAGAVSEGWFEQ